MATLKIRTTNHNGYVGIPLCPASFFNTNTINLNIDWGDGSSQTITSSNDPSIELNSSTQAITVKHSYVDKGGSALISISGGFGAPGQEKLAFAQASKQNSEGVAEDFDGRGPKSTPEKMSKIYGFSDFYIHGQGDFKDFSNLILLNKDMKILLSSDPASAIQLNSNGGTYLMNQTFENVGSLDSYLVKNSSGILIVNDNCTSLQKTFKNSSFNGDIGNWNVSSVTDASGMFEGSQAFQGKINGWNWAALKNASSMFKNSTYKQYVGPWFSGAAKSLEDASNMFEGVSFSGNPIDRIDWDMSTVKSTKEMFKNSDFSGGSYVNNWFVSPNVLEDTSGMFEGCTKFNRPIGSWDVSSVTDASRMFKNSIFNQGISNWKLTSAENLEEMFLDNTAFNKNINPWLEYFPKVKYRNNFEGSHASFKSPSFSKFKQIMTADVSSDGLEVSMNVDISDNLDCWAYRLNAYKKYVIKTGSNTVLKLDEGTYTVRIHAFATKLKGEALKAKLLDGTFVKGYDLEGSPKEALTEEDLTENIIGSKLYNLIQKQ